MKINIRFIKISLATAFLTVLILLLTLKASAQWLACWKGPITVFSSNTRQPVKMCDRVELNLQNGYILYENCDGIATTQPLNEALENPVYWIAGPYDYCREWK